MLNVSIVLYNPNWTQVSNLCDELLQAKCVRKIYLVDNSAHGQEDEVAKWRSGEEDEQTHWERVKYIWNEGRNLGYGRAHNIAIRQSVRWKTPYHLVMNADVMIHAQDLDGLYHFMKTNPLVGSLMPRVTYPNGELQYLCKRLPSPLDVFGRRFLPEWLMRRRNARYELRETGYDHPMNVPYLSGCFMLLRTEAVLKARLFDERYFMYPEDIDLTRTIHRNYLTLYYPAVTIVHDHARASYRDWQMTRIHIRELCKYFNKWGWIFDSERVQFNKEIV